MSNPYVTTMDIGIVFPKLYPAALANNEIFNACLTEILADPFFTAIEFSYMPKYEMRQHAARMAERAGVEVLFNGGDAFRVLEIDLSSLDEKKRLASVENAKMLVTHCYEMKAKIMHVVTGKYAGEETREAMLEACQKSLLEICAFAKENAAGYTLMISLETGDRHLDRKYLLGPTDEAVALAREIRKEHNNFGLLLDQSHFPVMQEDPYEALKMAGDLLTHVHLGNSYIKDPTKPYFGDKHLPFYVKDSEVGVPQVQKFLQTLVDIGFFKAQKATRRPTVSFEVGAFDGENAKIVIAGSKRVFLQAWEGLGR